MLLITDDDVPAPALTALAAALAGLDAGGPGPGPGGGLECSAVGAGAAARPGAPWPFLLHVNRAEGRTRIVYGRERPGDADLLMHYAVCRAAGQAVYGPAPRDVIGGVPRPVILDYLATELGWGLDHAGEAYAVLNACRALIYLDDGRIVSKLAGGRLAAERGLGPPAAISRAIDQQERGAREPGAAPDAVVFVRSAAARLRAAARRSPAGA
jgi:streptomycin 3"-adenylyltransferase